MVIKQNILFQYLYEHTAHELQKCVFNFNEALIDTTVFQYLNTEFDFINLRPLHHSNKVKRVDFLRDSTTSVLRSALHM